MNSTRRRLVRVLFACHCICFHSDDPDFDAKPMVLLVGQYSVGKTTFIRYLLERDFPGMRIGPEPTTDRFIAIMHGNEDSVRECTYKMI